MLKHVSISTTPYHKQKATTAIWLKKRNKNSTLGLRESRVTGREDDDESEPEPDMSEDEEKRRGEERIEREGGGFCDDDESDQWDF